MDMKSYTFQSRGKILISGEYVVLNGALSLALPLKFSQLLNVKVAGKGSSIIQWESWFEDRLFLSMEIDYNGFRIIQTNDQLSSERIVKLLMAAKELNSNFLSEKLSYKISSLADFDINYGIGSSSSLVSNIAWWSDTDPFKLNSMVFNGSGYDIACSRSEKAILYKLDGHKPVMEKVDFAPSFHSSLYFVYLGKKQDSRKSILQYHERLKENSEKIVDYISAITKKMLTARHLDEFEVYMVNHEKILSELLGTYPIKMEKFPDFEGEIKSCGAWGGDFVMVTWRRGEDELKEYFSRKGYNTVFGYDEFVF